MQNQHYVQFPVCLIAIKTQRHQIVFLRAGELWSILSASSVFKGHFLWCWMWMMIQKTGRYKCSWLVCACVRGSLSNWRSEEEQWLFLLLQDDGPLPKVNLSFPARQAQQGSLRSDINKKSQLTTLCRLNVFLQSLTSLRCEIYMASAWKRKIRAFKDLRSLWGELLMDCLNRICLFISSRIWQRIVSGWWFGWVNL